MTKIGPDSSGKREGLEVTPAQDSKKGYQFPEIRELNDVLVGELLEPGDWVVANVDYGFWPVGAQKQLYRGETVWIFRSLTSTIRQLQLSDAQTSLRPIAKDC